MLPKDLKKPVDDLSNASNKILVSSLLMAIMVIWYSYYRSSDGRLDDCKEQHIKDMVQHEKDQNKIDSLMEVIFRKAEWENQQYRDKDRYQDSIKMILQTEIKNELKRK